MKHGFRKRLSPDPRTSAATHARLREITHEKIHAMQIGGTFHVSPWAHEELMRIRREVPSQSQQTFASGMPLIINQLLPFYRKRGTPHSERWRDKQQKIREEKEKEKRDRERSEGFDHLREAMRLLKVDRPKVPSIFPIFAGEHLFRPTY